MPAALMVSTIHSSLRLLVEQLGPGPALLERLNHHIFASSASNKFVTLALAVVGREGALSYLCAGHNPALWVGTGGEVRPVEGGGLPLGLFPEASYEAREVELEPGELLCLYSDGITECAAPSEEEFGVGRLGELLREGRRDPLPELVSRVEQATAGFARGLPQADDQTLVLLRRVA
jgi:sigma-B regulation protein RsbU (phosphoserine phosphatase)